MENTNNLNLNLPEYGSSGWDKYLNENFNILDEAFKIALDGGLEVVVGDEEPLSPKQGTVWIDTSDGGFYEDTIYGRYKVYNKNKFEEIQTIDDYVDKSNNNKHELFFEDNRPKFIRRG